MDGSNIAGDVITNQTGAELRAFVERVERIAAEKRELADAEKEIYAEAKGRGYLVMAIRQIVKDRRAKPDDLAEFQDMLALYRAHMGMV